MRRRLISLCLPLALILAQPALSAPLDDANAAFQRGDYATAEKILLPMAEAGNPYAQYRLGMVYAEAMGEMRSTVEAAKWYESAALQGQPFAQYKLGILYVKGDGVPKDFVLAYMWFSISARHTLSDASEAARQRDILSARMTSTQIAEAKKMARAFRPMKFEAEPAPQR
ncbi:MAG: tetratricopeptide repeat protein [Reyranella sp.]|nr:tetratricopeptide repeat protein [Reyranella sp.]